MVDLMVPAGFIGSRVLQQLIAQGDDVRALVRTEAQAQAVSEKGAHPVQGDLTSLQVISEQAAAADAVVSRLAPQSCLITLACALS